MTTKDWLPIAVTLFFNIVTIAIPIGARLVDLNTDVVLLRERLENINTKVRELNEQFKHHKYDPQPPRIAGPAS